MEGKKEKIFHFLFSFFFVDVFFFVFLCRLTDCNHFFLYVL